MSKIYNQRNLIITIAILAILNVLSLGVLWYAHNYKKPPIAHSEKPHHKPPKGMNKADAFLINELNLSKEQALTLERLKREHITYTRQKHEEIRALKGKFVDAFVTENDSLTQAVATQIGTLETEIDLNLAQHFKDLKNICTEEQQEKLANIFREAMKMQKPPKRPER